MSALPPKADMRGATADVRWPIADVISLVSLSACSASRIKAAAKFSNSTELRGREATPLFARTRAPSWRFETARRTRADPRLEVAFQIGGSFLGAPLEVEWRNKAALLIHQIN